ncbi:MAG: hypothetical protein AAB656_04560 [Patescibacteria group bacterium]
MQNSSLSVTIRTSDGIVLQEEVKTLSAKNRIGKLDVLQNHANFISLIDQTLILETLKGDRKEIEVNNGILKVRENKIEVFLGVKK